MAIWLDQASGDFEARFAAFLTTKREVSDDVNDVVRKIIDDVRARGDVALADYSKRFDGVDFSAVSMRVTDEEIAAALASTAASLAAWASKGLPARRKPMPVSRAMREMVRAAKSGWALTYARHP